MACPCGLTREELTAQSLVENQRCKTIYLKDGIEEVCGGLFSSHPSAQGKFLLHIFSI